MLNLLIHEWKEKGSLVTQLWETWDPVWPFVETDGNDSAQKVSNREVGLELGESLVALKVDSLVGPCGQMTEMTEIPGSWIPGL